MNNFSEIGQAVGDINLAMEGNSRNFEEQAKISTPEAVPTLQATVDSLISDNVKLRERLSAIEAKLMTIDVEFNKLSEDSSIELPNKATVCEREKRLAMNQHAIGQTSELPDGNIDFSDSYFPRTLDIKDRMIADQQERRERTHEAVDDVEIYAKGSTCPSCRKPITKWCFVRGCFDWCLSHSAICSGDNGQTIKKSTAIFRDDSGTITTKTSTQEIEMCNSPEAGADCDIVNCEYSYETWKEEEFIEWMAGQSP